MLQLRVVQARYGDSLILENRSGKRTKYILIDGGPGGVYRPYLRGELQRIAAQGSRLELVVLSHVDNDHVIGLVEMMQEIKADRAAGQPDLVGIAGMWHNAFDAILPEAGPQAAEIEQELAFSAPEDDEQGGFSFGIREGEELQMADALFGIPRNVEFPQTLVTLEASPRPARVGGIKLWVLGPSQANLAALRKSWLAWLAKQREPVSFGVGEEVVKPDDSVNNLSSIMLLAEAGGRRVLLCGDGRGPDILAGLESIGLLKQGGTVHVDLFKLPHHGSARNCVGELFDRVLADTYVISADGRNDNPDTQTLDWLVEAARRQNRVIQIFATNWTDSLEHLANRRDEVSRHFHLTVLEKGATSAVL